MILLDAFQLAFWHYDRAIDLLSFPSAYDAKRNYANHRWRLNWEYNAMVRSEHQLGMDNLSR
jgi:hypothetical protein